MCRVNFFLIRTTVLFSRSIHYNTYNTVANKMAMQIQHPPVDHPQCGTQDSTCDVIEIRKIRQDLDMLVMLYKKLVDQMILVEEPSEDE